jgi:hypothetical protein
MNKWIVAIGILVVAVIAGFVLIILPPSAKAPTTGSSDGTSTTTDADGNGGGDQSNAAAKSDLIKATTPAAGSKVSSPLIVTGQARGGWYFEASFPYELKNAQGETIAQGPVQAQGDWMTQDFVPFSVTISFPAQPAGSKGTLLLKKDNPSGLPENEDQLEVPVTF